MLTVGQLRHHLAGFADETPVNLCRVDRSGVFHDRATGPLDSIDVALDEDGTVMAVWLVSASTGDTAPQLLAVTCACKQRLVIDDHEPWPAEHTNCTR